MIKAGANFLISSFGKITLLLTMFFVLFFAFGFTTYGFHVTPDLAANIDFSVAEVSGFDVNSTILQQGNKIIHYVIQVTNHGPGSVSTRKEWYSNPTAGFQATGDNYDPSFVTIGGKTTYQEGESSVTDFYYDTTVKSCGRVQIDFGFVDPQGGDKIVIGAVVNYGVDCGSSINNVGTITNISVPACSDSSYSIQISYNGTVSGIQVSANSGFNYPFSFRNWSLSNPQAYPGGFIGEFSLNPNTDYWARLEASGTYGSGRQFNVSFCSSATVPTNGGWSGWSPASCPTACGQSASTLTRSCTNPTPANGGASCSGSATQSCEATAACNTSTGVIQGSGPLLTYNPPSVVNNSAPIQTVSIPSINEVVDTILSSSRAPAKTVVVRRKVATTTTLACTIGPSPSLSIIDQARAQSNLLQANILGSGAFLPKSLFEWLLLLILFLLLVFLVRYVFVPSPRKKMLVEQY